MDALCHVFGYQAKNDDGVPNPETRAQFAERQVREWLKSIVMESEGELAGRAANLQAQRDVEKNLTITS